MLRKHLFDEIDYLDILDCNAGSHGHAFATNFNPEINIREVTQVVRHWENGKWIETPAIIEEGSIHFSFDYPVAGAKESYLLYHEELESLVRHIQGLKRARFWMTFSDNYLNHLRVLKNVGMTRIDEVDYEGQKIVPVKFLKALASRTRLSWNKIHREDRHRQHHDREKERKDHYQIYLQCLRP